MLGFTDHDRRARASTARATSRRRARRERGRERDRLRGRRARRCSGALSSDRLDPDDLAAGLYDNAEVSVHLVNWSTPAERHLLRVGHIGEVTREDGAFRAEIRGLAAALDETQRPRLPPRPATPISATPLRHRSRRSRISAATGTVTAANDRRRFAASGLDGFAAGWFERGRLTWTSGANDGRAAEVRTPPQGRRPASMIELWQPMHRDIAAGDAFTRHRRLRQALLDLPGEVRQRRQLPRLPAHAGQRLRAHLCAAAATTMTASRWCE